MRHDDVVFEFLKKTGRQRPEPLRGVPATRRMKNYAAASGYAYEYFFEGYRDHASGREYLFTFSGDRRNWRPFSLTLPSGALKPWEQEHSRTLADNERYAIAKTALFETFDRIESPPLFPAELTIEASQVRELAANLGLD
jgi:hypothetical protein